MRLGHRMLRDLFLQLPFLGLDLGVEALDGLGFGVRQSQDPKFMSQQRTPEVKSCPGEPRVVKYLPHEKNITKERHYSPW